ncbi:hypothetical protein EB235_26360 [Mesorhizobium loti R88b]|uniref:Uncharacterized protein n=2 Tax=Rhizobium loti TaxID=381 RepID=A0A6M7WRN8_RHILI|nr:hypothetical protein EB235_26360 [Mesorhizobium loti R88b]
MHAPVGTRSATIDNGLLAILAVNCGSGLAGLAYSVLGWSGTCLFGVASAAAALLLSRRR